MLTYNSLNEWAKISYNILLTSNSNNNVGFNHILNILQKLYYYNNLYCYPRYISVMLIKEFLENKKRKNDNKMFHVLILNCFCCQMNKWYAVNCASFVSTSKCRRLFLTSWEHFNCLLNMHKTGAKTLDFCLKVMISLSYCIPNFLSIIKTFEQKLKFQYQLNDNENLEFYFKWVFLSKNSNFNLYQLQWR